MPFSNELIKQLADVSILVIGDMMLDHYIWGDIYRISPEAPVPVVYVEKDTYTAGGAANVALNLANLGVNTILCGYCGEDEAGNKLRNIMNSHNVGLFQSAVPGDIPTIIKTRVVVRNQQLCRIDREAKQTSYQIEDSPIFKQSLYNLLDKVDAVIVSDYAKGVITQALVNQLVTYSEKRPDFLLTVDPKPTRQLLLENVDLLTPNRSEALLLAGIPEPYPGSDYPLQEVCQRIEDRYRPKMLVITLGADGMAVCQQGKVVKRLPTEAKEVYDVSGAGDTVIATITAALAAGADIIQAAQLANAAAACVVSHLGTAPICLSELKNMVKLEI